VKILTSFLPILMTISSKSDSGTLDLFRYDIVDMDNIGVPRKSSATMYVDGPLAYDDAAMLANFPNDAET